MQMWTYQWFTGLGDLSCDGKNNKHQKKTKKQNQLLVYNRKGIVVSYIKTQPPLYVDFDALSLRHVTSSFALTTHILTETLFNHLHFMLQFDLNEGKGKWTSDGLVACSG